MLYIKYLYTNILGLKIKRLSCICTIFIVVNAINKICVVLFDVQFFFLH